MHTRYLPWIHLRFTNDTSTEDGSGGGGGSEQQNQDGTDLGFPAGTAVVEMTEAQQVAYWKHQSRKHENRNKDRSDYEQLKADSDALKKLQAESQTEQEKAIQQARDEARREGENLGAGRYLTAAIRADLGRTTGKTNEELDPVMAVIDTSKFVDSNGDIDSAKLAGFAKTFGIANTGPTKDAVKDALGRTQTSSSTQVGSVNQRRQQRREELAKQRT